VTPRGTAPHDLQNLVDDLPHRVVEGTSHFVQMDDPATLDAILDEFLASVEAAATDQRGPVAAAR
jgi:pimeloyl-ACP methyl ester carboxylesterase